MMMDGSQWNGKGSSFPVSCSVFTLFRVLNHPTGHADVSTEGRMRNRCEAPPVVQRDSSKYLVR